jgi:hypothetical protein
MKHTTSWLSRLAFLSACVLLCTRSLYTQTPRAYLGFDSNEYPGDENLAELRKTFAFTGYWLNTPPGAQSNPWEGHRAAIAAQGFGFLVLFNGRLEAELKKVDDIDERAELDAGAAAFEAAREGFPNYTVIFLDQEEGGRLLDLQMKYVQRWIEDIHNYKFTPGVYCSGIAVKDGKEMITTAQDIRAHAKNIDVRFFVYNDACPPAPGCAYKAPAPAQSGTPFADVWQFAQSPRRKEYTSRCAATYSKDGNCHPATPSAALAGALLDLDSATSPDPSHPRWRLPEGAEWWNTAP